jgi:hypothetical protein
LNFKNSSIDTSQKSDLIPDPLRENLCMQF